MNTAHFTRSTQVSVLVVSLLGSVRGKRNQRRKMYVNVLKNGVQPCGNVEGR